MADRDCIKHPHVRPVEDSVSDRIEALLARADGLMTGREYHVLFDAKGEAAARAIAAADAQTPQFTGGPSADFPAQQSPATQGTFRPHQTQPRNHDHRR